jgi:hypothetical protein
MADEDKAYQAGIRDGRLDSLEQGFIDHREYTRHKFEEHEKILKSQEKIIWMLIGAFGLITFLPELKGFLG